MDSEINNQTASHGRSVSSPGLCAWQTELAISLLGRYSKDSEIWPLCMPLNMAKNY